MAEKLWIGTSWKMNKSGEEARRYAQRLAGTQGAKHVQRFIIPPFPYIREVAELLEGTDILVGAQNMHWEPSGAWTGEVSAPMLADCGARIVELGHSERRTHFNETDDAVGRKVKAAIDHGLIPLICIGETAAQKLQGEADHVLKTQVEAALSFLEDEDFKNPLLFAYEPVWAIGDGGTPAPPDYVRARHARIRKVAVELSGQPVPCLYGGSVNAANCTELVTCPDVDGLFIGRAAWSVEGYLDILSRCAIAEKRKTTA
ncbi:Triosephosphate isomerase 2 [Nitratireductor basaltis]|uniref:Triosephosphate isomerase n=2 Tax=Nitratireductor basaltis TaxID=472175 RepID=A0A084U8N6_9HYPH|nr:Triosephosphate isomerase 2 [Nitratireductor basaltis]